MAVHFVVKFTAGLEYSSYIHGSVTEQLDDQGLIPGRGKKFFSQLPCQDWLCGPPSLLSKGSQGISRQDMMLTTHLHIMLRSRMSGAILPLPIYKAWCFVSTSDNITFFTFTLYNPFKEST
jgi:hypothetical protein